MGQFLSSPRLEKSVECGEGNGVRWGCVSVQGWRVSMEDTHTCQAFLPGSLDAWSLFAVFDGHGGRFAAEFAANHLLTLLVTCLEAAAAGGQLDDDMSDEAVRAGVRHAFLKLDEQLRAAVRDGPEDDFSGTTVTAILLSPSRIFFINAGDSRAVLARAGTLHFATADHKPANPAEQQRIEAAGGAVVAGRVQGNLAVSRGFGDFEYKKNSLLDSRSQMVSPEPEVTVVERDHEADEFVLLACDGVWDVLSNEDLTAFVQYKARLTQQCEIITQSVVELCLNKGSQDNISALLVALPGFPPLSEDAAERERLLDQQIRSSVLQNFPPGSSAEVTEVVASLLHLPGLPPGGGIYSKQGLIVDTLIELNPPRDEEGERRPVVGSNSFAASIGEIEQYETSLFS